MKTPSIISATVELASLKRELLDTISAVEERARELQHCGEAAETAVAAALVDEQWDEFDARASRLRAAASYAHIVAADLDASAGRLRGLAWLRRVAQVD